jgi:hypothetical protein
MQKTQPWGRIIKLSPVGSPTTLLPHTSLHKSNTTPPSQSNLNFEDRMLKMMSDMFDRMVGEVTNMVG